MIEGKMNSVKAAYLKKLDDRIEHALNVVGAHMVGKAAHYCPVDTANLVNSLAYSTSTYQSDCLKSMKDGKTDGTPLEKATEEKTVKIGTNVIYAARIEFGFSGKDSKGRSINQGSTPFLRAALLSHKKDIPKIFARAFKEYDVSMK